MSKTITKNMPKAINTPKAKSKTSNGKVMYHGTSRAIAVALAGIATAGTINTGIGGGEFGRGFYAQDSIGNAFRRGRTKYGNNAAILVLEIDILAYHTLNIQRLTINNAQMLNARLTGNSRNSYTTAHDAIVGPLVFQHKIEQHKFQSAIAATLLNGTQTLRSVQP